TDGQKIAIVGIECKTGYGMIESGVAPVECRVSRAGRANSHNVVKNGAVIRDEASTDQNVRRRIEGERVYGVASRKPAGSEARNGRAGRGDLAKCADGESGASNIKVPVTLVH